MTEPFRTFTGGRVDRGQRVSFSFDGRRLTGLRGDTLASALLANGIHLVGRSFKYHRPRGILSAGAEEPNALVTVDRGQGRVTPNLRATEVEIFDGLVARSQNRWPSLAFDLGAVSDFLAPVFSAGFYYKTFMGPRFVGATRLWTKLYEPLIRRAAGLGRASEAADPDRYANRYAHCDVLVVGAGPAGLSAALSAAKSGARVILCDEQAELGGSLLAEASAKIAGRPVAEWLAETVAQLGCEPRVTLLARTQAFGLYAQGFAGLVERVTEHVVEPDPELPRERLWQVRAKRIVLATGAIERPLVFPRNDRPGIMLADAARSYVNRFGVRPGNRAVVLTATDSAYLAAADLHRAGIAIDVIADVRPDPTGPAIEAARALGIAIRPSTTVVETSGRHRVSRVRLADMSAAGELRAGDWYPCDLLLMSGGWTPSVYLFSQARGKLAWNEAANAFLPDVVPEHILLAGACRGAFGLQGVLEDGRRAAEAAVSYHLHSVPRTERLRSKREDPGSIPPEGIDPGSPRDARVVGGTAEELSWRGIVGALPEGPKSARAFVDWQNDVTTKDLQLAAREGFRSIEHVKRYTTSGMATDQGKTSNVNALAVVAKVTGRTVPEVGFTTFRQPYTPVTFGALAGPTRGDLFDPVRCTPTHAWAQANGVVFEDVGLWKRARYFPRAGEDMHAAVARECRAVRASVGVFDGSTLGKIEVVGPDAAEFLERIYVNAFHSLAVGRCRYGILLDEAGFVTDDGVIARLAPDRFHVTTTTGGAARVANLMEDYRQTEWPDLKVWLTSATEQWAVIAVQGPRARDVLAPLVTGVDLARERFAHMSVVEGRFGDVPCRLFRVSFTGELGFEVNVPADFGASAWEAIWEQASQHGGVAYGTEAMHVLRAEKGYIIVGQESDGTVTPHDLGLGWAIGKAKRDFVGKRSLERPDMVKPGRRQLVGLLTTDRRTLLEEGAQIAAERTPPAGTPALGHVTSAYPSDAAGRPIALALLANGRGRIGERLWIPMGASRSIEVEVVSPVFVDAKGERLHG
jgi:sarcosine oxidase, subunit alpha